MTYIYDDFVRKDEQKRPTITCRSLLYKTIIIYLISM